MRGGAIMLVFYSIERIEALTGIEFMPRMSVSDRRELMSEASAMWP